MRLKKIFKKFTFAETDRPDLTFGPNVRLPPKLHHLRLVKGNSGFPTTPDLFAKTRLAIPQNGRGWLLFMADVVNVADEHNVVQTSVEYRLSTDGVDELYWDGGAWVAAGPGDWNTEQEVNAGISSFPSPRSLQAIVNLMTNDSRFTPELRELRFAYSSDLEFQEDYVRSLLRQLKASIRPIARFQLVSVANQSTVNLTAIETGYNIEQIDSVFDITADSGLATDLFSSYDSNTKIITLTGPVPTSNNILVRFEYKPEIALTTGQDYTEISNIPAVVVEGFKTGEEHTLDDCFLINKETAQGFVWRDGFQQDLEVPMDMITDKLFDQTRLADEMKRFFRSNPFLTSLGLDEKFRLRLIEEYDQLTVPTQNGLHAGRLRARIVKAVFFPREAETVTGVTTFSITGGNLELEVSDDS